MLNISGLYVLCDEAVKTFSQTKDKIKFNTESVFPSPENQETL